eukprot:GEMP01081947.1.p1 GENE.GEMP01081947.1~~GEMP01081947.1.p1  ORF type:complete len:268 (-),score=43.32 GEMP01081947.1:243-1022(-)
MAGLKRSKTPSSGQRRNRGTTNSDGVHRENDDDVPKKEVTKKEVAHKTEQRWTDEVLWLDDVSLASCSFLGAMALGHNAGWLSLAAASWMTAFGGGAYCSIIKWLCGDELMFTFTKPGATLMWLIGLAIYTFGLSPHELSVLKGSVIFAFLKSWNAGILVSFATHFFKKRGIFIMSIAVYLYCYGGGDTSNLLFHGVSISSISACNGVEFGLHLTAVLINLVIERQKGGRTILPVVSSTLIFFAAALNKIDGDILARLY